MSDSQRQRTIPDPLHPSDPSRLSTHIVTDDPLSPTSRRNDITILARRSQEIGESGGVTCNIIYEAGRRGSASSNPNAVPRMNIIMYIDPKTQESGSSTSGTSRGWIVKLCDSSVNSPQTAEATGSPISHSTTLDLSRLVDLAAQSVPERLTKVPGDATERYEAEKDASLQLWHLPDASNTLFESTENIHTQSWDLATEAKQLAMDSKGTLRLRSVVVDPVEDFRDGKPCKITFQYEIEQGQDELRDDDKPRVELKEGSDVLRTVPMSVLRKDRDGFWVVSTPSPGVDDVLQSFSDLNI